MISWLFGCFQQLTNINQFECVYLRVVRSDWSCPYQEDISYLLSALSSCHQKINSQYALNIVLYHFEKASNSCFLNFYLKNLFLMDVAIDEFILVDRIAHYYNHQLIQKPFNQNKQTQYLTAVRYFCLSYFLYIQQKAKIYLEFGGHIFDKKNTTQKILQLSCDVLIKLIQKCLDLEKYVIEVENHFQQLNQFYKQSSLIVEIMVWILKNHFFFHRIALICFYTILDLKDKTQLNWVTLSHLKNLIKQFNNIYVKNFIKIIIKNSKIKGYKTIKMTEIQQIQSSYIRLLDKLILKDSFISQKQFQTQYLHHLNNPDYLLNSEDYEISVRKIPKKQFDIYERRSFQDQSDFDYSVFKNYQNNYHENYNDNFHQMYQKSVRSLQYSQPSHFREKMHLQIKSTQFANAIQ